MSGGWTEWNTTEYGWDWRVQECVAGDWTAGDEARFGRVELRDRLCSDRQQFTLGAEAVERAPTIKIWVEDPVSEELLSDDVCAALVSAVSLTTMPVVQWRDTDE